MLKLPPVLRIAQHLLGSPTAADSLESFLLNFANKATGDGLMLISACSLPSSNQLTLYILTSLPHLNPGCCVCRAHPKVKELLLEEMAELLDSSSCPGTADENRRNPDTHLEATSPPQEPRRTWRQSPGSNQAEFTSPGPLAL